MAGHGTAPAPSRWNSVGLQQPFLGSLGSAGELHAAMMARCHTRELVLLQLESGHELELLMNLIASLEDCGIGHHLVVASRPDLCLLLAKHSGPAVGCGWLQPPPLRPLWVDRPIPDEAPAPGRRLQRLLRRWAMAARLVSRGVNLLLLDSSCVVLNEPYQHLKHAPLADAHLLFAAAPSAAVGGRSLEPAAAYIQNVRPNGGAMQVLLQVVGSLLQRLERLSEASGPADSAGESAQARARNGSEEALLLQEAVAQVHGSERLAQLLARPSLGAEEGALRSSLELPGENASLARPHPDGGGASQHGDSNPMQARAAEWLSEVDAVALPVAAFDDVPRATPGGDELMGIAPVWLASSWQHAVPHDPPPAGSLEEAAPAPPAVMVATSAELAHATSCSGAAAANVAVLQLQGAWHWNVTRKLRGMPAVRQAAGSIGAAPPAALSLPPGAAVEAASAQEWLDRVLDLAVAAAAANRTLLWPPVACSCPWIWAAHRGGSADGSQPIMEPWAAMAGAPQRRQCHVVMLDALDSCRALGMQAAAFEQNATASAAGGWPEPSTNNTLQVGGGTTPVLSDPGRGAASNRGAEMLSSAAADTRLEDLQTQLRSMAAAPVVYVSQLFRLHPRPDPSLPETPVLLRQAQTCRRAALRLLHAH